jgi:hypothetical protein
MNEAQRDGLRPRWASVRWHIIEGQVAPYPSALPAAPPDDMTAPGPARVIIVVILLDGVIIVVHLVVHDDPVAPAPARVVIVAILPVGIILGVKLDGLTNHVLILLVQRAVRVVEEIVDTIDILLARLFPIAHSFQGLAYLFGTATVLELVQELPELLEQVLEQFLFGRRQAPVLVGRPLGRGRLLGGRPLGRGRLLVLFATLALFSQPPLLFATLALFSQALLFPTLALFSQPPLLSPLAGPLLRPLACSLLGSLSSPLLRPLPRLLLGSLSGPLLRPLPRLLSGSLLGRPPMIIPCRRPASGIAALATTAVASVSQNVRRRHHHSQHARQHTNQ